MVLDQLPEWQALSQHQQALADVHMRDLFDADRMAVLIQKDIGYGPAGTRRPPFFLHDTD